MAQAVDRQMVDDLMAKVSYHKDQRRYHTGQIRLAWRQIGEIKERLQSLGLTEVTKGE